MPQSGRRWGALLGMLVALCLAAVGARAQAGTRWQEMADTVFHPVARNIDLPTVLLPSMLAEDAAGFLWGGGETGLFRWDGYRFRSYAADRPRPDGLHDHLVQALHRDARGRLWVGTASGGLAYYDADQDRFLSVPLNEGHGSAQCVWAIDDDGHGGLWVATDTGLFHLGADSRVVDRLHHDARRSNSLPDDKVQTVLRDRQGMLWAGGRSGLARSPDADGRFVAVTLPTPAGEATEVTRLLEDGAGRIWIGTRQHGAYVIGRDRATARSIAATAGGEDARAEITAMVEVAPGRIWLGTYGNGIIEVDGMTLRTRRIRRDPFVPNTLDSDAVFSLYRDKSGIAWVGTTKGLSQYDPGNGGILTIFGDAGRTDGLTGEDVTTVLARSDGTLWAGSENNGIAILGHSGRREGALAIQRVFCLAEAPSGAVLVGTRNGLYVADRAGRRITALDIPRRRATAAVLTLRVLDGAVWLGGGDDGLWELQLGADGRMAVTRHEESPRLTSGAVEAIGLGPDGLLAVGTNGGVNLLNRTSGAIERILPDPADPQALSAGHVTTFMTDRRGRLWIGTDSAGLNVLVGRDKAGRPRFHRLGVADGLPNADVDKMLLDRQGQVLVSTDNGLAMIDPDTFAVRALRRADGVAIAIYGADSGAVTRQGELVFGGVGGMTVLQPGTIAAWHYRPPVVVTDIRIGGRSVPTGQAGGYGADPGSGWLEIPPGANGLAVEFSALDYSEPERNHYRYRLDGFDRDWVETDSTRRVAAYTNLPPGDYTLRLSGSNRDGVWTEQMAVLPIRVLPAWYQKSWFRLTEIMAAILLMTALAQGWNLILRRRQHELERQVAERTAELSASQQQLQQFAYFDALTALPNRRAFNEEFRTLIDAVPQRAEDFALLLIDLDGFKQVNDTLGHDAGDALLVVAAGRMREAVREGDFVARLGGDEFAILLHAVQDQDQEWSDLICQRIVSSMAAPITIKDVKVKIGASVGVALFPQHGQTQEELYKQVDLALYEAKHAGRGAWRWYHHRLMPAAGQVEPVALETVHHQPGF